MSIVETIVDIPMEHEKNVCGPFDSYMKKIERTLHVTLISRDGALKIIGPDSKVMKAKSVINNLVDPYSQPGCVVYFAGTGGCFRPGY